MAALRNAARHRPTAMAALLHSTDTSAALLRPAPGARRQLCDSAPVAKIAGSELDRVETAAMARYAAAGRSMDELTAKITGLSTKLYMKETDAATDLTRTSAKVCGLMSLSAVVLGGVSYLVINPPGSSSAPPDAVKQVDKELKEVKARLEVKITEWYEDEEAKANSKAVSRPGSGSVSKLKSVYISKAKPVSGSDPLSGPGPLSGPDPVTGSAKPGSGSGSDPKPGSGSGSDAVSGSGSLSGSDPVSGSGPDPVTGSAKPGSGSGSDPKPGSGSGSDA